MTIPDRSQYRPDAMKYFLPFDQEMRLARKLVKFCMEHPVPFTDPHDSVHHHWCALRHGSIVGARAQALGAKALYDLFIDALQEAEYSVQRVIELHLGHARRFVDPIDDAASMSDPHQIIHRLYTLRHTRQNGTDVIWSPPDDAQTVILRWAQREQNEEFELLRKLAVASQIMALMIVDPLWATSKDIQLINELLRDRVYAPGTDSVTVRIHGVIGREHPRHLLRDPGQTDAWRLRIGEPFDLLSVHPEGEEQRCVDYECRFVPGLEDGDVWLVSSTCRPKELDSTLIKLYAGREARDRRGFSHVLVIRRAHGVWRLCTHLDVDDYMELLRRRLLVQGTGLVEEPDDSGPNPDAHPLYERYGRKMLARFHRASYRFPEQPVGVSVEMKVFTVPLAFTEEFATDGMNHLRYKHRRLVTHVFPKWFPKLRRARRKNRG